MVTPPYLKPGDRVGIVAPARKVTRDGLDAGISCLESWGLKVELGPNTLNAYNQYSGTDGQRCGDFQHMIDNQQIRAVFCARGGYGSVRIIDGLNFNEFLKHPKWIVGYSDITVFHSHIHSNYQVETLHGEMPFNYQGGKKTKMTLNSLHDTLFGNIVSYEVTGHELNTPGVCSGMLVGGNLSILYSLMGTKSGLDTSGKILFIEDVDEYLYHIDRMMMNLKRTGMLENLAGLLVGGMTEMNDNQTPFGKDAYQIIADVSVNYKYPKVFGFPAGHLEDNRALILGRTFNLDAGEHVKLISHGRTS